MELLQPKSASAFDSLDLTEVLKLIVDVSVVRKADWLGGSFRAVSQS